MNFRASVNSKTIELFKYIYFRVKLFGFVAIPFDFFSI